MLKLVVLFKVIRMTVWKPEDLNKHILNIE
jgi:hypothetical protein